MNHPTWPDLSVEEQLRLSIEQCERFRCYEYHGRTREIWLPLSAADRRRLEAALDSEGWPPRSGAA